MTTHDIELPPIPDEGIPFRYDSAWGVWEQVAKEYAESEGVVKFYTADQVRAAVEAALQSQDREDAERYRWLCDKFGITKLPCAIERIIAGDVYVADGKAGIDAAIDHARRIEESNDASS